MPELLAGHPEKGKWLRRQAMSAWEIIEDNFEDDHVRAFLLWMAFMTMQPADRPGGGLDVRLAGAADAAEAEGMSHDHTPAP